MNSPKSNSEPKKKLSPLTLQIPGNPIPEVVIKNLEYNSVFNGLNMAVPVATKRDARKNQKDATTQTDQFLYEENIFTSPS